MNVWARIFPFLLVLMSLTGAFYPSVDLCAGEKERGTMETLLISPAARSEIVLGKFFTVMLASVMTAVLNLLSMGLTGLQIAGKLAGAGPGPGGRMPTIVAPPAFSSYFWMLMLLIPLSAFFSAICVALAVLARSMKEGQYYMTPLYLVSLPLILVTMMPEVSLNLFYSMVPITGVSLLLKSLILGEYTLARQYFLPVLLPTIVYSWLALKWAVDLFKREDVVFREAEVFDLRLWLRHLVRDKEPTPGAGPAILCFALMLSLTWFLMQVIAAEAPLKGMMIGHLAIVGPPLALTLLLCSDPVRTLRLKPPRVRDLALAGGLALTLNPLVREIAAVVGQLFPASEAIREQLGEMARQVPQPDGRGADLRPDAGDHRGGRLPRIHPHGPGADLPDRHGDRPLGLPVRVPPRPAQPLPAALRGDDPGPGPGPDRGPEREPLARDPLPLHQQRDRRPDRRRRPQSPVGYPLGDALPRPVRGPLPRPDRRGRPRWSRSACWCSSGAGGETSGRATSRARPGDFRA